MVREDVGGVEHGMQHIDKGCLPNNGKRERSIREEDHEGRMHQGAGGYEA